MTTRIGVAGVNLKIEGKTLIITSRKELRILSSAVLNGGLSKSRTIINHGVAKGTHTNAPERFLREVLRKKRLPYDSVGLMTAADVRNVSVVNCTRTRPPFCVIVTAGASNAMTAGDDPRNFHEKNGTINMIILLDGNPTDSCLVEIVKTVTEAKSLALRELDVISRASNKAATGTSTDTVTVASTCRGKPITYAGTATSFGSTISKHVIKAVKEALRKQDGITSHLPTQARLQDRKITIEKLMKAVSRRLPRRLGVSPRKRLLFQIKTLLRQTLRRMDTASMILASLKICEDDSGNSNSVHMARGAGASLAYLIGGEKAKLDFQRTSYHRKQRLSQFIVDGIASGIIARTLNKIED